MRKLLIGALTGVAGLLLTLLGIAPAQAVITQSGSCVDAGGVKYSASIDWNYRYESTAGVRASVSNLRIERLDSELRADDAGFDIRLRVYSSSTKIQDKVFDGYDPALDTRGTTTTADDAHYVVLNPANPRSNGDDPDDPSDSYSKVVLTIGTDADGLGDCTITFRQPAGLPLRGA